MKPNKKIIVTSCVAILFVALLRGCAVTSYHLPSTGMENSLYKNERILINKWSYGLRLPFMDIWGYHRWGEDKVKRNNIIVFNNPADNAEKSIGQRKVFIGRCIGLPGDTILIDSLYNVHPDRMISSDRKWFYSYPSERENEMLSLLVRLNMQKEEIVRKDSLNNIRSFSRYEYYLLQQAIDEDCWIHPLGNPENHNLPLVIPDSKTTVDVTPWNCTLLCNTLLLHEGRQASVKNDSLFIDGKHVTQCRFSKDYHWIVSDNPNNYSDSRLFGFVPKDHIIGKASYIWYSSHRKRIGKQIK